MPPPPPAGFGPVGRAGRKTAVALGPATSGIAPESRPPLGRSVVASIFGTADWCCEQAGLQTQTNNKMADGMVRYGDHTEHKRGLGSEERA